MNNSSAKRTTTIVVLSGLEEGRHSFALSVNKSLDLWLHPKGPRDKTKFILGRQHRWVVLGGGGNGMWIDPDTWFEVMDKDVAFWTPATTYRACYEIGIGPCDDCRKCASLLDEKDYEIKKWRETAS